MLAEHLRAEQGMVGIPRGIAGMCTRLVLTRVRSTRRCILTTFGEYARTVRKHKCPVHLPNRRQRSFCIALHGIARYDTKVKRRVVKRAFYSSEEDESTEEEFEEKDNSVAAPEVSRLLVQVLLAWQASVRYYATSVNGDLRGWENH